jgi:hypothetical protein
MWPDASAAGRSFPRKVAITFRSSSLTCIRPVVLADKFRRADSAGSLLMRRGCKNRLRTDPDCHVRIERAGLRKQGHSCPCCAADEGRTKTSKDLLPGGRRHSELRHRKCDVIASECGRQSEQCRDKATQYQRLRHGERDLGKCQHHAASGHGDDRCTEQAGAAMVGPQAGMDRYKLCGVLRYVAPAW